MTPHCSETQSCILVCKLLPHSLTCRACTFHNTVAQTTRCAVCGTIAESSKKRSWGSLRPMEVVPAAAKRQQRPFEYLMVLDFEWTADRHKPILPISELTQFPSVLVRLAGWESSIIDEFNEYVRPTLNPSLTKFSTELTGITQHTVDKSKTLTEASL